MPDTTKWLRLFRSDTREIRVRAATALLKRDDTPLDILLEILDDYSHDGLGANAERFLLKRNGIELFAPMIQRLTSPDDFIRQVACNVLGKSENWNATRHLLVMLDDPHIMVRRAAGFGLASLGDPSALETLRHQLGARQNDDVNVRWAIETAIQKLDPDAEIAG